jgi:eukaryotic-like serine/threonine-protein kinase
MKLFVVHSWKGFLLHLIIAIASGIGLLVIFFYSYLPAYTNHGETVTVPDLEGLAKGELEEYLVKRNLEYEVLPDSGYSTEYPPKHVLKQFPVAYTRVKENRKVFLTLNAENPPEVKMPYLIEGSVKNAQLVLKSYNLLLGNIKYVPDLAQNAVLEQSWNGETYDENDKERLQEGIYIPKGSKINLVVGDGLGDRTFEMPYLQELSLEETEIVLIGTGLKLGSTLIKDMETNKYRKYQYDDPEEEFSLSELEVTRQSPEEGKNVRIGGEVDVWVQPIQTLDSAFLKGPGALESIEP